MRTEGQWNLPGLIVFINPELRREIHAKRPAIFAVLRRGHSLTLIAKELLQ
jgi:hypothetical protein